MTVNKVRRTYITEVHNSLAGKIGKEGADTLTHYLEEVIPAQIEDKVQFLATKEDVANVRGDLKEDIANVKADLKENIANVKAEVADVRADLGKLEMKFTERLTRAEARMTHQIAGIKEDMSKLELRLTDAILKTHLKMEEILKGQTRWMVGIFIAIFMAMLALYFKK